MSNAIIRLIDKINGKLLDLEEAMAFPIRASLRFKPKQRVKFSDLANARGISLGRKGGVKTGTVTNTSGLSVDVLLDGYKHPRRFHNMFFNPMKSRPVSKAGKRGV